MNCSVLAARETACHVKKTRGRPPRSFDNRTVRAWLGHYSDPRDFCRDNPRAEDVLTGCARARGPRDTGRGLHSFKLFVVLQSLDAITALGVAEVLECADRTARVYAIAAEVASRAIAPMVVTAPRFVNWDEDLDSDVDSLPDLLTCEPNF
jgi:hypothetical protein